MLTATVRINSPFGTWDTGDTITGVPDSVTEKWVEAGIVVDGSPKAAAIKGAKKGRTQVESEPEAEANADASAEA